MKQLNNTPVFIQTFTVYYNGHPLERKVDNLIQAKAIIQWYVTIKPDCDTSLFKIVANKTAHKASEEFTDLVNSLGYNPVLAKSKLISGKGLRYKTLSDTARVRYTPEQYEPNGEVVFTPNRIIGKRKRTLKSKTTGEVIIQTICDTIKTVDNCKGVYYFRSMEHSKRISTLKKQSASAGKRSDITDFTIVNIFDKNFSIQSLTTDEQRIKHIKFLRTRIVELKQDYLTYNDKTFISICNDKYKLHSDKAKQLIDIDTIGAFKQLVKSELNLSNREALRLINLSK